MRIDRVELKNFRGFEHLELELHPRFTLLIGGNGSGKTNALEGLAYGLGSWSKAMRLGYRRFTQQDIRIQRSTNEGLAPSLEYISPLLIRVEGSIRSEPVAWRRALKDVHQLRLQEGSDASLQNIENEDKRRMVELERWASRFREDLETGQEVELPILGYYGTDRLWSEQRPANRAQTARKLGSRLRGYHSALKSKANIDLFESWMAWRTEVVLQRLSELIKDGKVPTEVPTDPLLDAVQSATLRCIDGAKRFFYDVNHQQLRLELESGELLPFSHLSDGYRNLVAMVADIAWRAAQLNPHHGADAAREATGVVLIDELELHLHPAWQRRVIDDLLAAFPKLQFVATTHSPQVIASARPEYLWLLHDGRAERPGPIYGKDSNAILRDIMGVPERPPWMQDKLQRLARLIEDGELEPAKSLLAEIRDDLGEDDPTVTGMQWELHDLEVHGAPDSQTTGT